MIPKTLSASSLNVAELCLARWQAENQQYSRGMSGGAATLGTTCHAALETLVTDTVMQDNWKNYTLDALLTLYRIYYIKYFDTLTTSGEMYDDGVEMLTKWFTRNPREKWEGVEVISTEKKTSFPIKTSIGEIPFNYIWDRFDKIGPATYRVVDYKSNRWDISPMDLKKKVQARSYALAAQIQHPDAEKIWVVFDMLRHDERGIVFSREENIATWKFLKASAERIIACPDEDPPETLNAECRFCVRKQSCTALMKNATAGGIFSIRSIAESVDQRANMQYQLTALKAAIDEIDSVILAEAQREDVMEFESENNVLKIGISARRSVDPERLEQVIGPEMFAQYGGKTITMTEFDKLLKRPDLTAAQKAEIRSLIYMKPGAPTVKPSPRSSLGED